MAGGPVNSNRAQHRHATGAFRQIVATHTGGGSPDKGLNAVVQRTTWTAGVLGQGGLPGHHGVTPDSPAVDKRPTGVFTVNDNNFAVDTWIQIGDFTFCSNRDFFPGANVGATATAIAAMFNQIPGWFASVNVAEVTVRYPHPGKVRFAVQPESAGVTNFNGLTPSNGFLTDLLSTGADVAPVLT